MSHDPEGMEIIQPSVGRNDLPWDNRSNDTTLKGLNLGHNPYATRITFHASRITFHA